MYSVCLVRIHSFYCPMFTPLSLYTCTYTCEPESATRRNPAHIQLTSNVTVRVYCGSTGNRYCQTVTFHHSVVCTRSSHIAVLIGFLSKILSKKQKQKKKKNLLKNKVRAANLIQFTTTESVTHHHIEQLRR